MTLAIVAALADQPPAAMAPAPAPVGQAQSPLTVFEPAYFAAFRPETAFDMISRLPGFNIDYGNSSRGFAGSAGNVRIDGQTPASRDFLENVLRRIPAASVARIELVTGGAPGVDMQGKAVVANIVRREEGGIKGTASAAGGLTEDGRGRGGASIQAERRSGQTLSEGSLTYGSDINGGEGARVRGLALPITSDFDFKAKLENSGLTAAREQPFAGGRLRVNLGLNRQISGTRTLDTPLAGAAPSLEKTAQDFESTELGARYIRPLDEGRNLQLTSFQSWTHNASNSDFAQGPTTSAFALESDRGESILRGTAGLPRLGHLAFEAGGEAAFNWLETQSALSFNGADVPLPAASVRVEELRGEVYANANWTVSPKLSVLGELRYETSNISAEGGVTLEKTLTYFKPRLTATITPAPGHLLVLRAERNVDQLSFNDFSATASLLNGTVVAGNPNLEPAISNFFEARYERRFTPKASLVVLYNYRDIENVVSRNVFHTPQGDYEAADNVGPGVRQSLSAILNLPLDRVGLKGGTLRYAIQFRDSELEDPLTGAPRRFSEEEEYSWRLNIAQDVPGSKFRWGMEAVKVGDIPIFLTSETGLLNRGLSLMANVDYRVRPDLTLRVEGTNLLDRRFHREREIYSAPRDVGVVVSRDIRDVRRELGGRGLRVMLTKTF